MATGEFFVEFDDTTQTKVDIFSLYARAWLPVFLSRETRGLHSVHIFDFFAGPGEDSTGCKGSPLRLLDEIGRTSGLGGWKSVTVHLHLFDKSERNIAQLRTAIAKLAHDNPNLRVTIECLDFESAFDRARRVLADPGAAKLVLMDQFGVSAVNDEVFQALVAAPRCDFLFFIASSTLYRFREHPSIKQKIDVPSDYFQTHRQVHEYYKKLLPARSEYYLAPFSLKRNSNINGIIFGSSHPRGIDKFLQVAWAKDELTGEANFDIDHDSLRGPTLPLLGILEETPRKVGLFEAELEDRLLAGEFVNEAQLLRFCYERGMLGKHASPVLRKLKTANQISLDFRTPQVQRMRMPRRIHMITGRSHDSEA